MITNKSERVIPGPPFLGILSPAATSIMYIHTSTNSGLKLAARLSPPLSTNTKSKVVNLCSSSSTAIRLIEQSSLIAVCGQPPVSTPLIRSGAKAFQFVKNFASSCV